MEHDRKPEDLGILAPLVKPAAVPTEELEAPALAVPAPEAGPVDPLARAGAFMHYADDDLRVPAPAPEPAPAPADDHFFPIARKAPAPLDDDAPPPPPAAPNDDPKRK